jgi:predicted metal-dependent hydrolase
MASCNAKSGQSLSDEQLLIADPRLQEAIQLFNSSEWYPCHDRFEELWHETGGPMRPVLQGILQVAVAHLHLERGNLRGATILLGEGLGRLQSAPQICIGLDLRETTECVRSRLLALQAGEDPSLLPPPRLLSENPEHPDP